MKFSTLILLVVLGIGIGFLLTRLWEKDNTVIRGHFITDTLKLPAQTIYQKGKPYPVRDTSAFQRQLDSLLHVHADSLQYKDTLLSQSALPFGEKGENDIVAWDIVAYPALWDRYIRAELTFKPIVRDTVFLDTNRVDSTGSASYIYAVVTLVLGLLLGRFL